MTDVPEWMLCIDPGLVSGLASLHYDTREGMTVVQSMEGDLCLVGEFTRAFLQTYTPNEAEVVAERFIITERTVRNSQAPWSLEVLGVVRWLVYDLWRLPVEDAVILQSPADAKRLVPNEILHQTGLWHRGGAGHANDAIRHGVRRYAHHGVYDAWTS